MSIEPYWEQTVNTHTYIDWEGKGELQNFSITIMQVVTDTVWKWSMNIIFYQSEQSISRTLMTREDAIKEAEFQLQLFINARQVLPKTEKECREWVDAICNENPEYTPHVEPKAPDAA